VSRSFWKQYERLTKPEPIITLGDVINTAIGAGLIVFILSLIL
jgi:hypothetical protein